MSCRGCGKLKRHASELSEYDHIKRIRHYEREIELLKRKIEAFKNDLLPYSKDYVFDLLIKAGYKFTDFNLHVDDDGFVDVEEPNNDDFPIWSKFVQPTCKTKMKELELKIKHYVEKIKEEEHVMKRNVERMKLFADDILQTLEKKKKGDRISFISTPLNDELYPLYCKVYDTICKR